LLASPRRLKNGNDSLFSAWLAEKLGIYDHLPPLPATALGARETTLMKLVTAYGVLANGGRQITASLIDRIQDRYGRTIWKHDRRECPKCPAEKWENQPEPEIIDHTEQPMDFAFWQTAMLAPGPGNRPSGATQFILPGSQLPRMLKSTPWYRGQVKGWPGPGSRGASPSPRRWPDAVPIFALPGRAFDLAGHAAPAAALLLGGGDANVEIEGGLLCHACLFSRVRPASLARSGARTSPPAAASRPRARFGLALPGARE